MSLCTDGSSAVPYGSLMGQAAFFEYRLGASESSLWYDALIGNRFGMMKSFWNGLSFNFFPAKKTPQRKDSLKKCISIYSLNICRNKENRNIFCILSSRLVYSYLSVRLFFVKRSLTFGSSLSIWSSWT